jgi:protease-4
MEQKQYDLIDPASETPRSAVWRPWAALSFLLVCLAAGLVLGEILAPRPAIGIVRFADVIWTDTAAQLTDVIEAAEYDSRIVGVVLELNTPGGLATSSEKLFYTLLKLRQSKPLVVLIDDIAASGGYYMAVAGNRIYASPSSYVGNVGVRGPRPFDPYIFPDELSTGPYKLAGGGRFDQIHQLDLLKEAFVGNVVHQRSLPQGPPNPLQIDAPTVAEARLYVGSEALGIGLIDAVGSRSDAIQTAADLAGVADYATVELYDYFAIEPLPPIPDPLTDFADRVAARLSTAPQEAALFLDSRIPLSGMVDHTAVQEHLLRLRASGWRSLPYQHGSDSEKQ